MKNKNGQILLITIMLLATVMTIVLSISFKSVTETQVTKLEEESQKALAAAESAIDVALKENQNITFGPGINSLLPSDLGFFGSATVESLRSKTFITPNIAKDGSYTFYLGEYDLVTKTIGTSQTNPADQNITLCFQSGPALEMTLVKASGVKKYVIDYSPSRITGTGIIDVTTSSCTPDNNYNYSTTISGADIGTDSQFLLVRVLYAPTKILFYRDVDLPIQGRTISSQATSSTSTGVSKKVVLFQSYPQIPGEFFTTTF